MNQLAAVSNYYLEGRVPYLFAPVGLGNESAATRTCAEPRKGKQSEPLMDYVIARAGYLVAMI